MNDFYNTNAPKVVPLARRSERGQSAKYLNPEFEIEAVQMVMVTEQIAGIQKRAPGKKLMSIEARRDQILDAINFLFRSF